MTDKILSVQDISIYFGGLKAVSNFNMDIYPGELMGLIGPNGAGKTTVFNMLTGVYTPTEGKIFLGTEDITGAQTHQTVQKGIARTFQNIRLFKKMSVIENVMTAMNIHMHYGVFAGSFRFPKFWSEEKQVEERALEILRIFDLDQYATLYAENLPYGSQRKLEIARALATNPKLLLLDEPAAGMNPIETEDLMKTIRNIRDTFACSILLIEHDMKLVLGICERVLVLDHGKIIANGTAVEVVNDPKVITAYLGTGTDTGEEEEK